MTIAGFLAGAVILIAVIFFIVRATGLLGTDSGNENNSTQQTENDDSGLVQVPDLVGKTEEEAKALVEEVNLGTQMIGEEPSTQEKEGFLPRIFPPAPW